MLFRSGTQARTLETLWRGGAAGSCRLLSSYLDKAQQAHGHGEHRDGKGAVRQEHSRASHLWRGVDDQHHKDTSLAVGADGEGWDRLAASYDRASVIDHVPRRQRQTETPARTASPIADVRYAVFAMTGISAYRLASPTNAHANTTGNSQFPRCTTMKADNAVATTIMIADQTGPLIPNPSQPAYVNSCDVLEIRATEIHARYRPNGPTRQSRSVHE